jgi:hypothetical protein
MRNEKRLQALNKIMGYEPEDVANVLSPLDIAQIPVNIYESLVNAPIRAGIGAAITNEPILPAMQRQFGEDPELAPDFGTLENIALDPTSIFGAASGAAKLGPQAIKRIKALNQAGGIDLEPLKILSGLKKLENENVKFALNKAAKDFYGKTSNFNEAGYVGHAGDYYDLSGRHWNREEAARFPSQFYNQRMVDHSEIPDAAIDIIKNEIPEELIYNEETSRLLGDDPLKRLFMYGGKIIRNYPGVGMETMRAPTEIQIRRIIPKHNTLHRGDPFFLDTFNPESNAFNSIELQKPSMSALIKALKELGLKE